MKVAETEKLEQISRVLEVRPLTDATSVIRFERGKMLFSPGQYLRIGIEGSLDIRDYSVYSGINDSYLEVLVRRVEDGLVSKQLTDLKPGECATIKGPYGFFTLPSEVRIKPLLLVATGTGLSPYHSFISSYPGLNYRLIHGTAKLDEAYESEFYGENYFHCASLEIGADFNGRVTDYLSTLPFDQESHVFLCGNCNMIYSSLDLFLEKGLPVSHIHTEVYF